MGSMYEIGAAVENFFWNLSMIPTMIEVNYMADQYQKDPEYFNKKEAKQEKKDEFEKAREAANADRDEVMTESVSLALKEKADDNALLRAMMVAKATETNKLIQYAFYYMTYEDAKLVSLEKIEREIINGIGEAVGFGKIYKDDISANLNLYDISSDEFVFASKYILSVKDIIKRVDDNFKECIARRLEQLNASETNESSEDDAKRTIWHKDENGIIHPVFFTEGETGDNSFIDDEPIVGPAIPEKLFNKLEADFGDLLKDKKHRYQMLPNNLVQLYITRDSGVEDFYTVDPGIVMGIGKTYVLANIVNDTLFVPTEMKDICKNILSSALYILTQDECQNVIGGYFRNMSIYRYLDMSNTEKLAFLDDEEFQKLGKKITYILNQLAKQNQTNSEIPRFRIAEWNSVDDFMIISDTAVVSPLSGTGVTSPVIQEGLIFQVNGDNITQRLFGNTVEFHIDKYGDL